MLNKESVFVFDKETRDIIRYILAVERFKNYVAGPERVEAYLCASSFERVIVQTGLKFPNFQKKEPKDLRIPDIIRFLEQKSCIDPATSKQLREYLDSSSSLMRASSLSSLKQDDLMTQQMLRFLCAEAGLDFNVELEQRTFEDLANLKVMKNEYEKLVVSDFDNFDRVYEKCPGLQMEVEKKLKTSLRSARISGFTPTTGGIWMPFVLSKASDNDKSNLRANIGIGLTPNAIRIGLDFGSQAHACKTKYYELLLSGELVNEFETLNRKDAGYCLCDTFWHYYIRNVQSLQWYFGLYSTTKSAIEKAIEENRQLGDAPLTGNRYLISKVIERRPEDFAGIVEMIVDEASKTLDELYPTLSLIENA